MRTPVFRSSRALVLAAVAACLLLAAGVAEAANATVTLTNTRFTDSVSHTSTTTINVGDTVTWQWAGGTHSTTSGSCPGGTCAPNGTWDSGLKNSGTFPRTFSTAGTFTYYCREHLSMMQGTIVVQSGAPTPTASFTFSPAIPAIQDTVTFTDTSAGTPTSWLWDFGDPASGTSNTSTAQNPTHVFLSASTYTVTLSATNAAGTGSTTKSVPVSNGGPLVCDPSVLTNLCLHGGRFQVTADWASASDSGHGTGVKLTDDSGYFWFLTDTNVELVVKVLNACPAAYWVFSSGLTNLGVTLTVIDTQTGAVYSYDSPLGPVYITQPATSAFPNSCP